MAAFPLKRVLDLRADRERSVAAQLVKANDVAARAESDHEQNIDQQRTGSAQLELIARKGTSVGEIRSLTTVLSALAVQAQASNAARIDAEAGVMAVEAMLATATQERRMIERLRERHDLASRDAEAARDRAAMDAAALGRFVALRMGKAGGSGR